MKYFSDIWWLRQCRRPPPLWILKDAILDDVGIILAHFGVIWQMLGSIWVILVSFRLVLGSFWFILGSFGVPNWSQKSVLEHLVGSMAPPRAPKGPKTAHIAGQPSPLNPEKPQKPMAFQCFCEWILWLLPMLISIPYCLGSCAGFIIDEKCNMIWHSGMV